MAVLSTGYRPLTSCPRSGLERSDFVHWHLSNEMVTKREGQIIGLERTRLQ